MKLNLERPIAFFDIESTGINVSSDRIVEISILKASPDGSKEVYTQRVNPTIPIPVQSSEIHGIYDADVAMEPTFQEVGPKIAAFMEHCDLAGFNSNRFDIPMLMEEFLRAGIDFPMKGRRFIDVQNIFHKMEQRTLVAAYKFYCDKPLENAHSAEADVIATYEVLEAQIERYNDRLENDMGFLHQFSIQGGTPVDFAGRIVMNEDNVEVFNFGKHKGVPVTAILQNEPGYYGWMMNGDFPLYTKKVLSDIKKRMENK